MIWALVYVFYMCAQTTSYEMRISDGSSDVCSSDLCRLWSGVASCTSRLIHSLIFITYLLMARRIFALPRRALCSVSCDETPDSPDGRGGEPARSIPQPRSPAYFGPSLTGAPTRRPETRRVGKEGVRTCRSRWAP